MTRKESSEQKTVRDMSTVEPFSSVTPEDLDAVLKVLIGPAVETDAGPITDRSGRSHR